jgi:hypothetical protein
MEMVLPCGLLTCQRSNTMDRERTILQLPGSFSVLRGDYGTEPFEKKPVSFNILDLIVNGEFCQKDVDC